MLVSEFDYELPPELIAQHPAPRAQREPPAAPRRATARSRDLRFADLPRAGRRARPAGAERHARHQGAPLRPQAERRPGRALRRAHRSAPREALALMRASHPPKPGTEVLDRRGARDRRRPRRRALPRALLRGRRAACSSATARAAAALHRARARRRRRRALPDRLRRAAGRGRRADRRPALRRAAARSDCAARGATHRHAHAARRRRHLPAGARRERSRRTACTRERYTHSRTSTLQRARSGRRVVAVGTTVAARAGERPRAAGELAAARPTLFITRASSSASSTRCSPTSTCRSRRC